MLNAIIRFSLRHRTLVIALCLLVLVYGGYLSTTLPIDVFPDLALHGDWNEVVVGQPVHADVVVVDQLP